MARAVTQKGYAHVMDTKPADTVLLLGGKNKKGAVTAGLSGMFVPKLSKTKSVMEAFLMHSITVSYDAPLDFMIHHTLVK